MILKKVTSAFITLSLIGSMNAHSSVVFKDSIDDGIILSEKTIDGNIYFKKCSSCPSDECVLLGEGAYDMSTLADRLSFAEEDYNGNIPFNNLSSLVYLAGVTIVPSIVAAYYILDRSAAFRIGGPVLGIISFAVLAGGFIIFASSIDEVNKELEMHIANKVQFQSTEEKTLIVEVYSLEDVEKVIKVSSSELDVAEHLNPVDYEKGPSFCPEQAGFLGRMEKIWGAVSW